MIHVFLIWTLSGLEGLGLNVNFKNLQVNFFFNYKKQIGRNGFSSAIVPGQLANQPAEIFGKQWQKPRDNATYAKFSTQLAVRVTHIFLYQMEFIQMLLLLDCPTYQYHIVCLFHI